MTPRSFKMYNLSDTPRTDAAIEKARPILQRERDAMYLLARQLERELAEAYKPTRTIECLCPKCGVKHGGLSEAQ